MKHIAILSRKGNVINQIETGGKTIESRWYVNRTAPWNRINVEDTVFFKESGKNITLKAKVDKVLQFEDLDKEIFKTIVDKYADNIQMIDRTYSSYYKSKKYVILIFLKNVKRLKKEITVDKKGYGSACAWMCLDRNKYT